VHLQAPVNSNIAASVSNAGLPGLFVVLLWAKLFWAYQKTCTRDLDPSKIDENKNLILKN
jgi:hypothetical protein